MKAIINYVITGVWFGRNNTDHEFVSHVMLHENLGDEIKCPGEKRSIDYVLHLLKTSSVYTCKWVYEDSEWVVGAEIRPIKINGKYYLHTVSDNDISNNLNNLINMACITDPELVPA